MTQSRSRRSQYLKYLNELRELSPQFDQAPDVQRGLEDDFVNEINEDELSFWVDPLDGSSGLADGHTEHLTCIIGVSVKNRPLIGVIHKIRDET